MGLKELVMVNAIVSALESPDVEKAVADAAGVADAFLDEKLKQGSEKAQVEAARRVLLPFARHLLKEEPEKFRELLENELAALPPKK